MEDLRTACAQLELGREVALPRKTTSWKAWSERLLAHATSDTVRSEIAYWLTPERRAVTAMPVDRTNGENTVGSTATITVALTEQETRSLLVETPAAYHTQINEVLLTPLAQTLGEWAGSDSVLVDVEGHGRELIGEEIDVSRTVGWFTTIFPVVLEVGKTTNPGKALKSVKEQLRSVPHQGIGYGLLRYGISDAALASELAALPQAEVSFNYLGQVDQQLAGTTRFGLAAEGAGPSRSPSGRRQHLLEINGIVVEGRLQVSWTYSTNVHERNTLERLAGRYLEALRTLIRHCQSPQAGGFTPSDFPETGLTQQDLDKLLGKIGQTAKHK
jgi:non-ribosomal peptide synthase protein (TIGR01720 family)